MNDTADLINRLSERVPRVHRLPVPWKRAAIWLAVGMPYVAAIVSFMGLRADLSDKLSDTRFLIEQGAALVTAVVASYAAFSAIVPGRPRWIIALPVAPLLVWLGSLGEGCYRVLAGPGYMPFEVDWQCFPAIVMVSTIPAVAMALMLRKGAPMYPHVAVGLGGLAAAAIGNFGLRFFHPSDASLTVLVWQFGTVALLAVVAGFMGPLIHQWRHLAKRG